MASVGQLLLDVVIYRPMWADTVTSHTVKIKQFCAQSFTVVISNVFFAS